MYLNVFDTNLFRARNGDTQGILDSCERLCPRWISVDQRDSMIRAIYEICISEGLVSQEMQQQVRDESIQRELVKEEIPCFYCRRYPSECTCHDEEPTDEELSEIMSELLLDEPMQDLWWVQGDPNPEDERPY